MAINNLPSADGTQNPWKDEVRPKINEVIDEVNTHKPVDQELTEGSDNAARSGDVWSSINNKYDPTLHSGRGVKVLQKNIVDGINTVDGNEFKDGSGEYLENTTFVIRHSFDLINWYKVGRGTMFLFDGGSFTSNNDSRITMDSNYASEQIISECVNGGYQNVISTGNGTHTSESNRRNIKSSLGYFNVLDYGVKNDGSDTTSALKTILEDSAIIPSDSVLYFPRGVYKITDTISPKYNNITIMGDSMGFHNSSINMPSYPEAAEIYRNSTVLLFIPTEGNKLMFGRGNENYRMNYENLSLVCNTYKSVTTEDYANGVVTGAKHRTLHQIGYENVSCAYLSAQSYMKNCIISGFSGVGVHSGGLTSKIDSTKITNCGTGVKCEDYYTGILSTDTLIHNSYISMCGIGVYAKDWLICYGLWIDEIETYGIYSPNSLRLELTGGHFNHIDYAAIYAEDSIRDSQIVCAINRSGAYYAGFYYSEVPNIDKDKCCQIYSNGGLDYCQITIKNTTAKVGDIAETQGGICISANIVTDSTNKSQINIVGDSVSDMPLVIKGIPAESNAVRLNHFEKSYIIEDGVLTE